jgi:predicted enzyme related to lactoylglutathione lyase
MLLKASLPDESSQVGKSTHIVLDTDDMQAECERLKLHGAQVLYEPKRARWGNAIETHFADPDGNILLLVQQAG